jgi:hypothetical protein
VNPGVRWRCRLSLAQKQLVASKYPELMYSGFARKCLTQLSSRSRLPCFEFCTPPDCVDCTTRIVHLIIFTKYTTMAQSMRMLAMLAGLDELQASAISDTALKERVDSRGVSEVGQRGQVE